MGLDKNIINYFKSSLFSYLLVMRVAYLVIEIPAF